MEKYNLGREVRMTAPRLLEKSLQSAARRELSRSLHCARAAAASIFAVVAAASAPARAASATECTAINVCYCINADLKSAIDANVATLRQRVAEEKSKGKAVGYLSIPLSTAGGSYFKINKEIAAQAKARIEQRYGENLLWLLNPGADEASLPAGASGADYMLMWTRILEGDRGLGEDFDFIYFTGPSDFAGYFGLTGTADMEKIEARFNEKLREYPDMQMAVDQGRLSKSSFRNYYALRASVAFSSGSHDEWNIVRIFNERRRGAGQYGVVNQLPILFDGRALPPGSYEDGVAFGYAGRCMN
jgi:hypothetical protein